MEKNKVKLKIAGSEYSVFTDDDVKYVAELGEEVNAHMTELMRDNARLSVTQAAILCTLDYADNFKKAQQSAENLRSQIQEYLEDAARARTDAEITRREAERLGKELAALRARGSSN